ncbi:uncharacterized protein LOC125228455 isoform X2 [Leguminivora glycinivorella]|uniref:uncharacterized protein LOC125228455 isoform X2 n=1 Tax=Leguminivora glycinivorella TaxID=1035111 RepID=UPI00200F457D|nr:uncharacterized protein LOC125228455 isoform X2 [Leguminivora glycinivorella]
MSTSPDGFVGRRNRQHILLPKSRSVSPSPKQEVQRQETPKPESQQEKSAEQESRSQYASATSQAEDTRTPTSAATVYSKFGRLIKPPRRLDL